jgi:hypothetical protein
MSLTSHRSHEAATRAAGQLPHNPLMAGRRRRTAAAAHRSPRFRCRCRSSNRSTCVKIECHSSPPRSTRRRPRDRLCSMAWRVTTVRTTTQDNLTTHWSSSTPSLTDRGRRRPRPGRTRSSALNNRRHLLRHKAHCSSERERPSVRAARRLCAAACVSWVPEVRQPWPAGRSTTRTASFMINGTKKTTLMCSRSALACAKESLLAVVRH